MYEFVVIITEPKETTHLGNCLGLRPLNNGFNFLWVGFDAVFQK